jgi:Mannosyl-glycoprotein endo-beta-N-acetylglucosaminidase
VLALAMTGGALTATAGPASAITVGWDKSSSPQMAKTAADAKSAAAKKEKAEAAAAAAAAALAALEREQAAEAVQLLNEMGSEERQFSSLGAYSAAQEYVRRAQAGARAAAEAVQDAIGVWKTSKLEVLKALAAEVKAKATVRTYEDALTELGLAVYTGAAAADLNYVGTKEAQLAQDELAGVAATATAAGLKRAKLGVLQSIVNVRKARATVLVDWGKTLQAKVAQRAAVAQVTLSRQDVSLTKLWATIPGAAPAQPVQALALLEGKFAPRPPGGDGPAPSASDARSSLVTALASATQPAPAQSRPADLPASLQAMAGDGPAILGASVLSPSQIAEWFASTGYHAHITVPFGQLVADYFRAAQQTGVRADIAFAQSIVETGYFSFPSFGQDAPAFNNFAGIGACDTCKHGWQFPSAMTGVLSQEELLEVYATPPHLAGTYGRPTSNFGIEGCCLTWMSLAGTWASSPAYGYDILNIYNQMLAWALPRALQSTGLLDAAPLLPRHLNQPAKSSPGPSRTAPT